ncbi:hypothetical protein MCOR31_005307 [Pyricularia oryzae]|nr:hypothetical protein MCOR31_005307 [Pyricularia oryzae]
MVIIVQPNDVTEVINSDAVQVIRACSPEEWFFYDGYSLVSNDLVGRNQRPWSLVIKLKTRRRSFLIIHDRDDYFDLPTTAMGLKSHLRNQNRPERVHWSDRWRVRGGIPKDLALIAQSLLLIMWKEVKQQRKRRPGLAPAGEQWNEAGRLQTLKHLHHWARSQLTASSKSGFIKVPGCQETVWGVIRLWAVTAGTGNVSLAGRCPLSGLGRHTGQVTIMLATNGRL